ncbi:MAG: cytochrome c oxidase subunit 3 [Armatimonadota bacterium]|nr:cytochrome c oxidase subunit 3 [Armatimonadota bacterium]MDR5703536.1 cytochrome c oxidase subunit 3 [Armatimonadota bacterium]
MTQLLVKEKTKESAAYWGTGFDRDPPGGGGWGFEEALPSSRYSARIAVWFLLAAIAMLFMAFTSTYLSRRTVADWVPIAAPRILWANTTILLVSSGLLEWSRRALRRGSLWSAQRGFLGTTLLGCTFLAGQILAWRQLVRQGIGLQGSPHGAFFFLLTGAHGLHILGAILALAFVTFSAWKGRYSPGNMEPVDLSATFWHFLDGLWLYLFLLLF